MGSEERKGLQQISSASTKHRLGLQKIFLRLMNSQNVSAQGKRTLSDMNVRTNRQVERY